MKTVYYETIDSTNEEAKRRFAAGEAEPLLIWANMQTAGKGRNGRSFYSPENTGLYFSVLYPCSSKQMLQDFIFVTTAAAVAVCKSLRKNTGADAGIKWINDVYVGGKKACGILAEATYRGDELGVIVGIGINLSTKDFPKEISDVASGIGDFTKEQLHEMREAILADVGDALCDYFKNPSDHSAIIASYRQMSVVLGKEVSFVRQGENEIHGIAKDILDDGSLLVACEDGEHILNSGEIHLSFYR